MSLLILRLVYPPCFILLLLSSGGAAARSSQQLNIGKGFRARAVSAVIQLHNEKTRNADGKKSIRAAEGGGGGEAPRALEPHEPRVEARFGGVRPNIMTRARSRANPLAPCTRSSVSPAAPGPSKGSPSAAPPFGARRAWRGRGPLPLPRRPRPWGPLGSPAPRWRRRPRDVITPSPARCDFSPTALGASCRRPSRLASGRPAEEGEEDAVSAPTAESSGLPGPLATRAVSAPHARNGDQRPRFCRLRRVPPPPHPPSPSSSPTAYHLPSPSLPHHAPPFAQPSLFLLPFPITQKKKKKNRYPLLTIPPAPSSSHRLTLLPSSYPSPALLHTPTPLPSFLTHNPLSSPLLIATSLPSLSPHRHVLLSSSSSHLSLFAPLFSSLLQQDAPFSTHHTSSLPPLHIPPSPSSSTSLFLPHHNPPPLLLMPSSSYPPFLLPHHIPPSSHPSLFPPSSQPSLSPSSHPSLLSSPLRSLPASHPSLLSLTPHIPATSSLPAFTTQSLSPPHILSLPSLLHNTSHLVLVLHIPHLFLPSSNTTPPRRNLPLCSAHASSLPSSQQRLPLIPITLTSHLSFTVPPAQPPLSAPEHNQLPLSCSASQPAPLSLLHIPRLFLLLFPLRRCRPQWPPLSLPSSTPHIDASLVPSLNSYPSLPLPPPLQPILFPPSSQRLSSSLASQRPPFSRSMPHILYLPPPL
ncbi:hypothetical protein C7M84_009881 [Penaeus vannamei]|uniref:Uncharacterized protein n=1 Tax=Penaeus vannamei TaxID=6689 RepID=A0A3R7M4N7_PENVA|nr:hypothetical protein C7M84_009881 [Penaeus vannamei]